MMLDWVLDPGEDHAASLFRRDLISAAETRIKRSFSTLNSAIVAKHGAVVFAKTYDKKTALSTPAPVYSVTKSVIATLIGDAIARQEIKGVDQSLDTLLADELWVDCASEVKSLTLHQLLTMTTGFKWTPARSGLEPLIGRIVKQPSWVKETLALPIVKAEQGQFNYNSAVSHLLSAILTHVTGSTAEDLAISRLFEPLDIASHQWDSDSEGYSTGGWGLSLSPIDMTKLGVLYCQEGRWMDHQVIDKGWIEQMWYQHTPGYGYQWWRREACGVLTYCAQGLGGQFICCVPEHGIVIVLTSDFAGRKKDLWPMLETYWLPAAC